MIRKPLAKADIKDMWFAWDMLEGMVAPQQGSGLGFVWDMLAGSAIQQKWGDTWFAWDTLAGMVHKPLAKANPDDTWFAFKMLAGSAIHAPSPKSRTFTVEPSSGSAKPSVWESET